MKNKIINIPICLPEQNRAYFNYWRMVEPKSTCIIQHGNRETTASCQSVYGQNVSFGNK